MELSSFKHVFVLSFLGLAGLVSVSCAACPDCSPVLNCTPPAGAAGSGPEPSALLSDTPCSSTPNSACNGGAAPAPYECMVYAGCDNTSQKCLLRQPNGTACSAGSPRNCIMKPGGTRGVTYCNGISAGASACNWPDNSGCVACGGAGEACCVGGCIAGKVCKDGGGTPDLLNKSGSTCQ